MGCYSLLSILALHVLVNAQEAQGDILSVKRHAGGDNIVVKAQIKLIVQTSRGLIMKYHINQIPVTI